MRFECQWEKWHTSPDTNTHFHHSPQVPVKVKAKPESLLCLYYYFIETKTRENWDRRSNYKCQLMLHFNISFITRPRLTFTKFPTPQGVGDFNHEFYLSISASQVLEALKYLGMCVSASNWLTIRQVGGLMQFQ